MIDGLQNFFKTQTTTATQVATPISRPQVSSNPFANPFLSQTLEQMNNRNEFYGKNQPFAGGYFAGYYNDKPNIVGRKLFVEV
jgi:hypothetical protein